MSDSSSCQGCPSAAGCGSAGNPEGCPSSPAPGAQAASSGCGGGCGGPTPEQQAEEARLQATLSHIRNTIVVMSGKGGVGKSSTAANIAAGLALAGKRVGLLDVDVHGPSIPRLLKLDAAQADVDGDTIQPVLWREDVSLKVMSLGFFLPDGRQAVIWRGPVKMGFIKQLLSDVAWGELDFLVVDCPPGTGDEPLSVLQLLGEAARALIVTTPQAVAVDDVRRSLGFCEDLNVPVLGVIENMSGIVCSKCGNVESLFGQGGGERLAKEMNVPFLGAVPLDPEIVRAGDEGNIYIASHPDRPAATVLRTIVDALVEADAPQG
ncbi:Mrp/NBP35 family ATP-binding protein [Nitratidesulfovibrio sp. HK-II]|uniref:Mrp/NBP35 family ATP-binding protein n=1 Tax=Nitratidesulfovibrio sp. HK-II TaxID=2009266 RepID=UPI000E2ECF4E|nr:Mrp/NBP35 family ATP-binding protein [Nitratidesulfovibrio sp. HK-II]GBO96411.1 cytosolic Fe-S cluster assembling factor NBP35 [Nitratidesulfovibrio sp. HK-II]